MEPINPQNAQIEITPEFYQLLKQYTGSVDHLEDPNFDVAAYLNEKFPDFKSLEGLSPLTEKFEKEIGELDEEIDTLMCERATYNDELKNYININNIENIYLCGIDIECCVLVTALNLFENGYNVFVLKDYVYCTHGEERKNNAIEILKRNIGEKNVL